MESNNKNSFQSTLNLPKTDFSIRANAAVKEPEILQRWEKGNLAQNAMLKNKGNKKFVLHSGPPYANGNLHLGHALTYILKDIVCKAKRMAGFHAPLVPGWDCHGLPIEHKMLVEQKKQLSSEVKTAEERVAFKKQCRAFADHWIAVQREELKGLGNLADYNNAYITMAPEYEASIIRSLARFVEQGYIERKLKTVPWCHVCQTVLAIAEIEHKDRTDPSIYMLFALVDDQARMIFPLLFESRPMFTLSFVLWTTTPWSIPLNRGVGLNPKAVYAVIQGRDETEGFIVAKDLAGSFCEAVGIVYIEIAEADATVFYGKYAKHALVENLEVPIFLDEAVLVTEGTACLSCAPGCGPEDYALAQKHNLEVYSPVSVDGKYTKGIIPTFLEGMKILEAQKQVPMILQERKTLVHQGVVTHSYPHCWRCRNGLMFRATNQWFCDLQKKDLINRTLEEIKNIRFVPDRGQSRLSSFISHRTEWCISRQRQWGTPITALLCDDCDAAWLDANFLYKIADEVAREGIEFWDRMTPKELARLGLLPDAFICLRCNNSDLLRFSIERDILDVWFDSGSSSYAVLEQDLDLGVPADAYFEGSDQHRGWFQSSLLCGMVLYGHTQTKTFVTHGFILDEKKRKMSKSLGNVIAPQDVITKYSRDVLRLWVAGADFENDLVISDSILSSVAEMYKKIRNTLRFLLANIYDFNYKTDAVFYDSLRAMDKYALACLYELSSNVKLAYDNYHFSSAIQAINVFCTNTLSAVYLDVLKDRLYVEQADGENRRSAQTVLYHLLDVLSHLIAPVLSFLAEEVTDCYQKEKFESVHVQDFVSLPDQWQFTSDILERWVMLEQLRISVLKSIEDQRSQGVIKHSYESGVTLWFDEQSVEYLGLKQFEKTFFDSEVLEKFLAEWCVVSHVVIVKNSDDLKKTTLSWLMLSVNHASGIKCPRCWQWQVSAHPQGLCGRCQSVVG